MSRPLSWTMRDYKEIPGWAITATETLEAEVARLRDIITPGEAAGYEVGMAALEAEVARLRTELDGTLKTIAILRTELALAVKAPSVSASMVLPGVRDVADGAT